MLLAGLASVLGALACLAMYRRAGSAGRSPVSSQASFRSVLSVASRDLVLTACSGFVLVVAQFCVLAFLVLYLHATWRVPVVEASLLLAATQLVGAAARIAWGWVSDRLFGGSRKRVLVTVSLFAAAAGMALAALPGSATWWLIVPVVLAFGAGALGWNGIYITLLAELGRPGFQGRSVALGLTLNQLGIVLGPWLFGTLVDTTGSFRLTWALVAVALLGAAALVAPVRERRRA